jgi:hypothetical protein
MDTTPSTEIGASKFRTKRRLRRDGLAPLKLHDVPKGTDLCTFAVTLSIDVISLALCACLEAYRREDEGQGDIISVQTMKALGGGDARLSHYLPRQ